MACLENGKTSIAILLILCLFFVLSMTLKNSTNLFHICYNFQISDEIAKQINDCGGKIVITIPQLVPLVEAARASCPSLTEKSIVISAEAVDGCHSFFEMLKTNAAGVDLLKGSDINATEDGCLLPYSSGTTVKSDNYCLCKDTTHRNFKI